MDPGASSAPGQVPAPHEIRVTEATDGDLSALARMHLHAARSIGAISKGAPLVEELSRGEKAGEVEASFADGLARRSGIVLVGSLGEVPVGYGVLRADGARGRISELWVDPEARFIGVGSAILAALTSAAREAGMRGLDSVALPGDRNTKNFFEDHSMAARAIIVGTSEL